jgi:hypothetical protein
VKTARPRGRPTRFPGKPTRSRLTVSLTRAGRERVTELSQRMSCSLSDAVEYCIWQSTLTTTSTGDTNDKE